MKGYERLWIIGDEFCNNTVHQHFRNSKHEDGTYDSHTFNMFEVSEFTSARSTSNTRNILSRIRNNVATALNEHSGLPKLILFVLDDDIITSIPSNSNDNSLTKEYEYVLNSLITMLERVIDTYKDWLPSKAKRENIPHLLWIAPPSHRYFSDSNNEKRAKFTSALGTVVTLHDNNSMLRLVKFWDHNDTNLFLEEQYRFTNEGLNIYWRSIDAGIKFWGLALAKKFDKKSIRDKTHKEHGDGKDATPKKSKGRDLYYRRDNADFTRSMPPKERSYDEYNSFKPRRNSQRYYDENQEENFNYYDRDSSYRRDYDPRYKWQKQNYHKTSRRLPY